jgi:hypothetical protein
VKTVWKADLAVADVQTIIAPIEAEFLHVANQYGKPRVWFRCNPDIPQRPYTIAMVGTGHPAPINGKYLGTILIAGDSLVFHFFVNED